MTALPSSLPLVVRLPAVGSARGESVAVPLLALKTLLPAATDIRSVTIAPANDSSVQGTLHPDTRHPLKGRRPFRFTNADQYQDRPDWLPLGKLFVP